jgi:hypothetical protein
MKELLKTETTIFPAWTSLLRDEPSVSQRLERIQTLREKRSNLNFSIPYIHLDSTFWQHYELYARIRRLEEGHSNLSIEQDYQAHNECISIFTPLVHRIFWARWLYLERAFELASLSGDLLFGAVSLRTLVEDVWALLELAAYEERLKEKRSTVTLMISCTYVVMEICCSKGFFLLCVMSSPSPIAIHRSLLANTKV